MALFELGIGKDFVGLTIGGQEIAGDVQRIGRVCFRPQLTG